MSTYSYTGLSDGAAASVAQANMLNEGIDLVPTIAAGNANAVRDAILAEVAASLSGSGSDTFTTLSGNVIMGASPPVAGAIRVDAASYVNAVMVATNGTADLRLQNNGTVGILYMNSSNALNLGAAAQSKWQVLADGSGTASFSSLQATARIVGGSTNGLAIRNSANTRDNFRVYDNGSTAELADGTRTARLTLDVLAGERTAGFSFYGLAATDVWLQAGAAAAAGGKAGICYYNQTQYYSALEVANVAAGFGTLALMKSGGLVVIGTDPGASGTGGSQLLRTGGAIVNGNGAMWASGQRGGWYTPSNGTIALVDDAGTNFGRLMFGGTTNAFPSLKRSAAALQVRLADDSDYTNIVVSRVDFLNGSLLQDTANGSIRLTSSSAAGFTSLLYGPSAGASTSVRIQKPVTTLADNTFTDCFTVTVPNAAHAATIKLLVSGQKGAGDAEGANGSTSSVEYVISVQRTSGVTATAAISAAIGSIATTIAAGNAVTATAQCSAMTGGAGVTQTFTIQIKVARAAGASTNHTAFAVAELLNANATGITIA